MTAHEVEEMSRDALSPLKGYLSLATPVLTPSLPVHMLETRLRERGNLFSKDHFLHSIITFLDSSNYKTEEIKRWILTMEPDKYAFYILCPRQRHCLEPKGRQVFSKIFEVNTQDYFRIPGQEAVALPPQPISKESHGALVSFTMPGLGLLWSEGYYSHCLPPKRNKKKKVCESISMKKKLWRPTMCQTTLLRNFKYAISLDLLYSC